MWSLKGRAVVAGSCSNKSFNGTALRSIGLCIRCAHYCTNQFRFAPPVNFALEHILVRLIVCKLVVGFGCVPINKVKTKNLKNIGSKPLVLTEWVLKLVTCSRFLSKPSQVGWSAFACDGIVPYD